VAANTDLNIFFTFSYLRNEYPQMKGESTTPRLYPFVTEITVRQKVKYLY
jgi:hypothetical protein